MIKEVTLVLSILFILCGCDSRISKEEVKDPLFDLGYTEQEISKIHSFSEELQNSFTSSYNSELLKLINEDNPEEAINKYKSMNFDIDTYLYLKEHGYLDNKIIINKVSKYIEDKYYLLKNLDLYLKYSTEYSDVRSLIEYVNTKSYKKAYEEYEQSDTTKGINIIASKVYYLGEYEPKDLVEVEDDYKYSSTNPTMVKEAYEAFKKMADDSHELGLNFTISSAYRSHSTQDTVYNNYLKKDPQSFVDTYSSRPGFSDHQTGLAADLKANNLLFEDFTATKEAEWLKDNAYKYGFVIRYPKGKDKVTGYMYESWHYRYVGKEAAKEIYENNITFDEYYAYYLDK